MSTDQPASPIERALSGLLDAEVETWRRPLLFNARRRETDELRREAAQVAEEMEEQ